MRAGEPGTRRDAVARRQPSAGADLASARASIGIVRCEVAAIPKTELRGRRILGSFALVGTVRLELEIIRPALDASLSRGAPQLPRRIARDTLPLRPHADSVWRAEV